MRVIYLHGYNGKFNEDKYKILSKFGDVVHYPEINYQIEKNIINNYSHEFSRSKEPVLIVGSSLGAYMAFHISNIIGCPALLINPAFFIKSGGTEIRPNYNSVSNYQNYDKTIILSLKDEIIDFKRTIKYLNEIGYKEDSIKIYDDLTHILPIDVFEKEFSEFREKHSKIKPKKEKKLDSGELLLLKSKPSKTRFAVNERFEPINNNVNPFED